MSLEWCLNLRKIPEIRSNRARRGAREERKIVRNRHSRAIKEIVYILLYYNMYCIYIARAGSRLHIYANTYEFSDKLTDQRKYAGLVEQWLETVFDKSGRGAVLVTHFTHCGTELKAHSESITHTRWHTHTHRTSREGTRRNGADWGGLELILSKGQRGKNGWTDGQTDGRTNKRTYVRTNEWTYVRTNDQMKEWWTRKVMIKIDGYVLHVFPRVNGISVREYIIVYSLRASYNRKYVPSEAGRKREAPVLEPLTTTSRCSSHYHPSTAATPFPILRAR